MRIIFNILSRKIITVLFCVSIQNSAMSTFMSLETLNPETNISKEIVWGIITLNDEITENWKNTAKYDLRSFKEKYDQKTKETIEKMKDMAHRMLREKELSFFKRIYKKRTIKKILHQHQSSYENKRAQDFLEYYDRYQKHLSIGLQASELNNDYRGMENDFTISRERGKSLISHMHLLHSYKFQLIVSSDKLECTLDRLWQDLNYELYS